MSKAYYYKGQQSKEKTNKEQDFERNKNTSTFFFSDNAAHTRGSNCSGWGEIYKILETRTILSSLCEFMKAMMIYLKNKMDIVSIP